MPHLYHVVTGILRGDANVLVFFQTVVVGAISRCSPPPDQACSSWRHKRLAVSIIASAIQLFVKSKVGTGGRRCSIDDIEHLPYVKL